VRLGGAALDRLALEVERPDYDRATQAVGIVHFGMGAFHRAHQAWYTDRAMGAGDRGWAITGVSLRSADVAAQMNPQDALYTVTERSGAGLRARLVGAVREVLVAPIARDAVIAALAAPATHIVSLTIPLAAQLAAAAASADPLGALFGPRGLLASKWTPDVPARPLR
jgi:fructuronate reductase